jgi:hypothetical protein
MPSFLAPVVTQSGGVLSAVGDFNHDGRDDVILQTPLGFATTISLSVLLANPDGTFRTAQTLSSGGLYVFAAATGDFNRDGKLDLVTAISTNGTVPGGRINVFLGNGDGTFQPPRSTTLPSEAGSAQEPVSVAVGDMNKDGFPDVVVVGVGLRNGLVAANSYVDVLLGSGNGTFRVGGTYAGMSPKEHLSQVYLGDFNGDGNFDVVTRSGSVFLGAGNGKLHSPTSIGPLDFMAVGDINGDGRSDIVSNMGIYLGNSDGTFRTEPSLSPNAGIFLADLNHDGKLDVLTTSLSAPGEFEVFLGKGDGTFQALELVDSYDEGIGGLGDFDGDGFPDIVQPNYEEGVVYPANGYTSVSVLLNDRRW